MKPKIPILRRLMLLALCAAPLALAAAPADTAAADKIIARWLDAVGGAKRIKAVKCSEYQLRQTANNFAFTLQVLVRPNGAYRAVIQTPAGEFVSADDGRIGWTQHPSIGGRVLPADEAARARRQSGPQEALRVRDDFPVRRRLPDETLDGKTLQVIELADAKGESEKWWFNQTTGLRVRREVRDAKKGSVTDYSDYRKVDGIVEPFRGETTRADGGKVTTEVLAISHRAKDPGESWSPSPEFVADAERVDALLQRHLKLLGSEEALAKVKTRKSKIQTTIPSSGTNFEMTITQKAPNRVLIEQTIPGMGLMLQGFDGAVGWAWSELQGYRQMQGLELAQLVSNGDLRVAHQLGESTPLRKWVGERTEKDGRRFGVVEMGNALASAGVFHFDLDSGLLARVETLVQAGPGGSIKVVAEMSDYRDVDGLQLAFRTVITNPAMQIELKMLEVENNPEVADEIFAPRKTGKVPVATPPAT